MDPELEVENSRIEGMVRKLKRGKRFKSVSQETGIRNVILDGGLRPEDSDIKACNQIITRSKDEEAKELWEIGCSMGILGEENRERVILQLEEWEKRDGSAANNKVSKEVKERSLVPNADS